jgi:predicted RND superfamily exporter protein
MRLGFGWLLFNLSFKRLFYAFIILTIIGLIVLWATGYFASLAIVEDI